MTRRALLLTLVAVGLAVAASSAALDFIQQSGLR